MAKLKRGQVEDTAERMNALHRRLDAVIAETRRLKGELEGLQGRDPLADFHGLAMASYRDRVRGSGQSDPDGSIH